MAEKAILFDATKCTACRGCQVACKQWNLNDEAITTVTNGVKATNRGSYENPPDLSSSTWLKMRFTEVENGGKLRWLFTRQSCMHCTEAACVKVCPNGTLYHNELVFVEYNKDSCIGCGYCIDACPFSVPRFTRNLFTGIAKMDKCTLCTTRGLDRVHAGMEPACVKTCPPGALDYGDRDALVARGRDKVAALKTMGMTRANLYGETELGGLHVLYVLDDAPEVYKLPVKPRVAAVTAAWLLLLLGTGWSAMLRDVAATLPGLCAGALVALGLRRWYQAASR